MKREYGLTGDARKQMVAIIGEVIGVKPEYLRMPSCAYAIGGITVTKDGTMIWDGRTADTVIDAIEKRLVETGLTTAAKAIVSTTEALAPGEGESTEQTVITEEIATEDAAVNTEVAHTEQTVATETEHTPETTGIVISFPLDGGSSGEPITPEAIENLKKIIASKATLIKKALNADQLDVNVSEDKISFPWWNELPKDVIAEYRPETPDGFFEITAYSEFLTALVKMAKEAKRVTAVEKPVESEKYAFRVFLLRLGFGGSEHKKTRSILLKRLSGHSAFPTKAAVDAFYARQREKKAGLTVITEGQGESTVDHAE